MTTLFDANFSSMLPQFFFPFVRILTLSLVAPIIGEKTVPIKVKIGLSLFITLLLPHSVTTELPFFSLMGLQIILQQIVIGLIIGFTMQIAFMTVRFAGELIGVQMGLSIATFYDPAGGPATPVISRLLNAIAILIFLSLDGHLWLLLRLAESFDILPINATVLQSSGYLIFLELSALLFSKGLLLALPLISLLLIINLALGLVNRLTPQLSIFVIGFPLTLLLGLITLSLLMPMVVTSIESIFSLFFERITVILQGV